MFDRFVRLAQARRALCEARFDEVLRLVDDPLVRGHRQAEQLRGRALDGLVDRARARAEAGALAAALLDGERVLAVRPDDPAAAELVERLRGRSAGDEERTSAGRNLARDARLALERGDLADAERLAAEAAALAGAGEIGELTARIRAQRARAAELRDAAQRALAAAQPEPATDQLARARALDSGLPGGAELAQRLAVALEAAVGAELAAAAADGGPAAARSAWDRRRALLPELGERTPILERLRAIEAGERRRLVDALARGEVEAALQLAPRADAAPAALRAIVGPLERARELAGTGALAEAARVLDELGRELGIDGLGPRAERLRTAAGEADRLLGAAREAAAEGRLVEARARLLEIVATHPGHAVARQEIEMLDRGAEDRARRLAGARDLARERRLREAAAGLVALAVPGPEGEEPRLLLRDLQQRMDTVAAGVRQTLRALHGRDSASREGLAHCLRRLDELDKVQADSVELASLRTAIAAEIRGLDRIEAATAAIERGDVEALRAECATLVPLRGEFLEPARLDARILALVDQVLAEAGRALAGGRAHRAEGLVEAARSAVPGEAAVAARIQELQARIAERQVRAAHHVAEAEAALGRRDLEVATAALLAARESAADDPGLRRLDGRLDELRRAAARLDRAGELAGRRDHEAARHELDSLGPTPSLLRTRIFDLNRTLAVAQGLDGPFLLRVDEGGEFLVVRGESLTIGNLRDGSSDLPILANLAGCHARLRRTLSFHGGQEDRIEAERGPVSVDGRPERSVRLANGVRVRLGTSVDLLYRLPSERSLSAVLALRGGFQIAGTDTLIWMKDRGRDGRILLGPGADCHVQVARATGVVEVFAGRDGQVRVRAEQGGTIDGRPFQGEHPATAGVPIEAAGISFVLQPWHRG